LPNEGEQKTRKPASQFAEIRIEQVRTVNRIDSRTAWAGQSTGDLVWPDSIGKQRSNQRACTDSTKEIQIDDRSVDEARIERAEHAKLPKQPFDAAARQTHGDSAASAPRKQSVNVREQLAQVRVDEDMPYSTAAKIKCRSRSVATRVDQRNRAIWKNGTGQRSTRKQTLVYPKTERKPVMACIQNQDVGAAVHRRSHGVDVVDRPNRDDAARSTDAFASQHDAVLGSSVRSRQIEQRQWGSSSSPDENNPVHSGKAPYVRRAN
jgi:hypothetical protein